MRDDKPILMSTHGPNSSSNASKSLVNRTDLTPITPELRVAGLESVKTAYVWAFRSGSNVVTNPDPIRPGDLCVTTQRLPGHGDDVFVRRLFPVLGVLFNAPTLAPTLGIAWKGDGWENLVLLDDPLVLDPPVPFRDLDAAFDVRPGPMFTSKFLRPSLDELLDWLGVQTATSATTPAPLAHPVAPITTVAPSSTSSETKRRLGTVQFRRDVATAYGTACAACGFDPGFFAAAHLKDWAKGGPDEWWNGLPLCPNHHVLFDRGRIRIRPVTLDWVPDGQSTLEELGVNRRDINVLPNTPLPTMIDWKWNNPIAGR